MMPDNDESNDVLESDTERQHVRLSADVQSSPTAGSKPNAASVRMQVTQAVDAWLVRSNSNATRENYAMDLTQFLDFIRAPVDGLDHLLSVRPAMVAAWRDHLRESGLTNSSIRRK